MNIVKLTLTNMIGLWHLSPMLEPELVSMEKKYPIQPCYEMEIVFSGDQIISSESTVQRFLFTIYPIFVYIFISAVCLHIDYK